MESKMINMNNDNKPTAAYDDDAIRTLSPREHLRLRPGMYIGKLGDGSQPDDGIYVLIKETVDNSIDEFIMGAGNRIDITIEDNVVTVRDYGRGIPLKSLSAAVSKMNTGGKYSGEAFKKTVGLNGVGVKAVNMLSSEFTARSVRDGEAHTVTFAKGLEVSDKWESGVDERTGTCIRFRVDEEIFGKYSYNMDFVEQMVRNYTYLNLGLKITLNGQEYVSKNGLLDLVNDNLSEEPLYPPIHLSGEDIEVVITHGTGYGESYYSFVNGQYTSQGGTHQAAFREAIANALVHRLWDVNASIRVSMFEDRIEISSPGGLPAGISEEEYLNGQVSILRNPIIGNVFFRLKYIEKFGTGIMRINHAYERALEKPSYRIFANSICVSLPVITLQDGLSEKEKVILRLIRKKGTAARSILEQESGMGRDAVIRVLNELLKRNIIAKRGKGRGTRYEAL